MIVAPKIRGFICTTAHPTGCAKHIADQIAVVKSRGPIANGPKKAQAVYDMIYGPVTPKVPASILQLHTNCTVVADEEALALCPKE